MALAERASRTAPKGRAKPRIAPPTPARSQLKEFHALAAQLGIELYPWQDTAARYLTALGAGPRWLYREVAIIVARQNGKTTLLIPLIASRLLAGQRVMHAAQNRELPREIHDQLGSLLTEHYPEQMLHRRGIRGGIRYGSGQEEIRLKNGGHYRIVAATPGGARGPSNDLVIVDELREMATHAFIAAAKPTLNASPSPQMVYLSNAGTEDSEVLNAVKARAEDDPALAYLEWSAPAELSADNIIGWAHANPSLGHKEGLLESLSDEYRAHRLAGTLAIFETEYLCRWVASMQAKLVADSAWLACHADLEKPIRPMMGISMDPSGTRASAAMAWQQSDGTIGLRLVADDMAEPVDTDALGTEWRHFALRSGVSQVGFDDWTDKELARHFRKMAKPIKSSEYVNASENFVRLVNAGRLRWDEAEHISADLPWTARKTHDGGAFSAVKAKDERSITAVLAAIRAVWLASGPKASGVARIY